jgi:hypothetical protein
MAEWTIRVAQLPVSRLGANFNHNMIVVMDPMGRVVSELNGGPLGADGKIIPFGDPRWLPAYTSGDFPVGGELHIGAYFYRPGLNERVGIFGNAGASFERLRTADACIKAINSAGAKYTLFTGPRGGRDDPSAPTFNSNSVNASLLQCMGIPADDAAISRQQGFDNPILPQDQVREIIEQQKSSAPPAGSTPPANIPIPRPKPQKRGDDWDNSNTVTFADLVPSASSTMQQNGAPGPENSALPQHVIDTGNLLRANGYEITPRTMYLAHVLGPQGAVDLMKRTGSTSSDAVPSPDAATGDQMRAWMRALRLGPAVSGGIIGGMAPAPDAALGTPDPSNADAFDPARQLA